MGDTGAYVINEKVLVPHIDKYYEAKILKAEYRADNMWYYYLHYTGWNKKYDEWVEETGLAKAAGEPPALDKKKAIIRATLSKPAKNPKQDRAPSEPIGPNLNLEMPAAIKKLMLDEYEMIVDDGKILPLPRRPNVNEVLQQYVDYVVTQRGKAEVEEDICLGVRTYFDKCTMLCLLYRQERAQAEAVTVDGKVPSSVFGAEHLSRLLLQLPSLLPAVAIEGSRAAALAAGLNELLAFMAKRSSTIFAPKEKYVLPDTLARPA